MNDKKSRNLLLFFFLANILLSHARSGIFYSTGEPAERERITNEFISTFTPDYRIFPEVPCLQNVDCTDFQPCYDPVCLKLFNESVPLTLRNHSIKVDFFKKFLQERFSLSAFSSEEDPLFC
ncbi:MAG: hypothetical protein GX556_17215 [Fibrobacter sp.]|nr:hypothetical protein [Fibrobacter sp.]